jgi:hypothetical protein
MGVAALVVGTVRVHFLDFACDNLIAAFKPFMACKALKTCRRQKL